jgi:hypothetical protein
MATILEFPYPRRIAHDNAIGAPAEVVIFPGVRIDRSDFNLADRLTPARRRRKTETRNQKPEIGNQKSEG